MYKFVIAKFVTIYRLKGERFCCNPVMPRGAADVLRRAKDASDSVATRSCSGARQMSRTMHIAPFC